MADIVFLEGMRFFGFHGNHAEERALGQRFVVDVELHQASRQFTSTDDINSTSDYGDVFRRVRDIVEGPPRNLIETVAEEIAARLLEDFPGAESVSVTVRKPEASIKGSILAAAGVRIHRTRERAK